MTSYVKRGCMGLQDLVTNFLFGAEMPTTAKSFYEIKDSLILGNEVSMSEYQGDVLLIVNVASK